MPTAKTEDDGTVKAPRRRTPSASIITSTPDVTEAKPPASATSSAAVSSGVTLPVRETPRSAEDDIRRRAYELYEQDGRQDGRDREHWLRAEAEVLGRSADRAPRRSPKSA